MWWRCCKIMCYQNKVDDIVVTSLDLDVWIKLRLSSHHLTFTCFCRLQIIPPTCPLKNPRTGSDKISRKANNIVLSCKYSTSYLAWSVNDLAKRGAVKGAEDWRAPNEIEERWRHLFKNNNAVFQLDAVNMYFHMFYVIPTIYIVILLHYENI